MYYAWTTANGRGRLSEIKTGTTGMAEQSADTRRAVMRFYRWTASSEGNSVVRSLLVRGWEDTFELKWRLEAGCSLSEAEWDADAVAYWEEGTPLTDLPFTVPDFELHSPRLTALFKRLALAGDVQYLRVLVKGDRTGQEVADYSVANYLRRVPCLDLERSVYTLFGPDWIRPEQRGLVAGVLRPVLRKDMLVEERLFRVDECEAIVVINEDVKQAIEEAGITGCYILELEVA